MSRAWTSIVISAQRTPRASFVSSPRTNAASLFRSYTQQDWRTTRPNKTQFGHIYTRISRHQYQYSTVRISTQIEKGCKLLSGLNSYRTIWQTYKLSGTREWHLACAEGKGKGNMDLYSAKSWHLQVAQAWITQFYLQAIPCLPLPCKCSPDCATTNCRHRHLM